MSSRGGLERIGVNFSFRAFVCSVDQIPSKYGDASIVRRLNSLVTIPIVEQVWWDIWGKMKHHDRSHRRTHKSQSTVVDTVHGSCPQRLRWQFVACKIWIEIETIEGGQKDVLLRRTNIKKYIICYYPINNIKTYFCKWVSEQPKYPQMECQRTEVHLYCPLYKILLLGRNRMPGRQFA